MLNENIKALRKSKGLSQQELAVKLNVVRQTVSKWEQGLSVPDSDMLVAISEVLETPVSTLLGKNSPLVTCRIMRRHSNDFCVPVPAKKPLPGVGLWRTRNRHPWSRVPCIGMAVRQSSANCPHLRRHWNFYDAKERIK